MKRLTLMSFMLLATSQSWGAWGTQPDYKNKLWRSSYTENEVRTTQFSSGSVVIHSIIVGSPTVNSESHVALSKSTSTTIGTWLSTFTTIQTNRTTTVDGERQYFYDVVSDSYTFIQRTGPAKITVLWDWLESIFANPKPE